MSARLVGVSLKSYFGHAQTLGYCRAVATLAAGHPAVRDGRVELFVIPSFTALESAQHLLAPAGVKVGAQDMYWEDAGPYTGEIGPAVLAELGVRMVEIGHAERRALFGETDADIGRKVDAALRAGLVPLICVGESDGDRARAAEVCRAQLGAALAPAVAAGRSGEFVVAYEPVWAIGADAPASSAHVGAVCLELRTGLSPSPSLSGRLIYGGSAGAGLLGEISDVVDGLFLGRRAHQPAGLFAVIDEAAALSPPEPDI